MLSRFHIHAVNQISRNRSAVLYLPTAIVLSLRILLCLVAKCRNLKQAAKDITNKVFARFRCYLRDVMSFLNGIALVGLASRILCRRTGKHVAHVAATIDLSDGTRMLVRVYPHHPWPA